MDRYPYAKPPRWWSPRPSKSWMRLWRPIRRYQQQHDHHVRHIEVRGLEHLQQASASGCGVLVTPNHASHADCFPMLEALDRLPYDRFIMMAWQVFEMVPRWQQLAFRHHGCFSVDREGTDLAAYRQTIDVLSRTSFPLVIFPEGEVYHLNDHVTPFHEGPLLIASSAVKRSGRPVACVPCALKYRYIDDPTSELLAVVRRIERHLDVAGSGPLTAERIERLTLHTVRWRERQYLGSPRTGPLVPRIEELGDTILGRLERRCNLRHAGALQHAGEGIPQRARALRRHLIQCDGQPAGVDVSRGIRGNEMQDIFVAVQLYSYRPGYVAARPTIERIAETVDKLEEDVLGAPTAGIRAVRDATVTFGEPLTLDRAASRGEACRLAQSMSRRVQTLLDAQQPALEIPA